MQFFEKELQTVTRDGGESESVDPGTLSTLASLSLFGKEAEKQIICTEILKYGGNLNQAFFLCHRNIQYFGLPDTPIYTAAAIYLVQHHQVKKIDDLLKNIKPLLPDSEWDKVIRACVDGYVALKEDKSAERMVTYLKLDTNKIDANIACGKLKAAYLIAVRANKDNAVEVQRIRQAAILIDSKTMVALCDAYFKEMAGNRGV